MEIKLGTIILDKSINEEYEVYSIEGDFLRVQLCSMKNAGLEFGKEVVHKSQVDGENIVISKQ